MSAHLRSAWTPLRRGAHMKGVSFTMGTPWLAVIIPVFAVFVLLSFMVMPGMLYNGEHKVSYIGVAKRLFDLYSEQYRTAILFSFICLPIIFIECLLGMYQRGTESKAAKVVCNLIAFLGIVLIVAFYLHLTYEN